MSFKPICKRLYGFFSRRFLDSERYDENDKPDKDEKDAYDACKGRVVCEDEIHASNDEKDAKRVNEHFNEDVCTGISNLINESDFDPCDESTYTKNASSECHSIKNYYVCWILLTFLSLDPHVFPLGVIEDVRVFGVTQMFKNGF